MSSAAGGYDAVLVTSYGGPEGPNDVLPFLQNATRGRGIPPERLFEVAEHYNRFGGISPINEQNRALVAALQAELNANGPALPIFLGNRNWHPYLEDTIREMRDRGIRRALALVTSAYRSYSGCRQYREDIARACAAVGEGAPQIDKLRAFYNHPGFIEANAASLRETLEAIDRGSRSAAHVVFTAHSVPVSMARHCDYEVQLQEASRLVADAVGVDRWTLTYQSRSGPPQVPWLGPDIAECLGELAAAGVRDVAVLPIGFVSDHLEVIYDLDHEARKRAGKLGLRFHRAESAGTRRPFIAGLRALILERTVAGAPRLALGVLGPGHDVCLETCCLAGQPAPTRTPTPTGALERDAEAYGTRPAPGASV